MDEIYDVVVIGCGSMGSATIYELSKLNLKVLAIDQFSSPHEKGSHTGESRIIRQSYFEHPNYVPLLQRSYQLWDDLERNSNQALFTKCGLSYFGKEGNLLLQGVRSSAEKYKIELIQNQDASTKISSTINMASIEDVIFEPQAGYVEPEKCISAFKKLATNNGAKIIENCKVNNITSKSNVQQIECSNVTFFSKRVIVTAGAYVNSLLQIQNLDLKVTQQSMVWMKPKSTEMFESQNFPCWFVANEESDGAFYGFPIVPNSIYPNTVKIAYHYPATAIQPHEIKPEINKEDLKEMKQFIDQYFPEAFEEMVDSKNCLYTVSKDEHFIIDFLPDNPSILFATGFSGHGFKFVPVIGEILSQLSINGTTILDVDFLKLDRFTG